MKCKECEVPINEGEFCANCNYTMGVAQGLKIAATNVKCKMCATYIGEELKKAKTEHSLGVLTRLSQIYGGYEVKK